MNYGVIRIGWLGKNRDDPCRKRHVSIDARGKFFWLNQNEDECDCMLVLLTQLDVKEISIVTDSTLRCGYSLIEDGWAFVGGKRWILQSRETIEPLKKLMRSALKESVSYELLVVTTQGRIVTAIINDNDEYWFLQGSPEDLNENWITKCEESLPKWTFFVQ